MGIGGGIFLISLGAILAFAVVDHVPWLDLHVVGWVLMLAGSAILILTIYFWSDRRRKKVVSLVEESRLVHEAGPATPDPPEGHPPETP